MDLLTTEYFDRQEQTWNVVDREGQELENADWKKKISWNRLQAQVLLAHSNCI